MAKQTVVGVGSHAVDVDDGRTVGPGDRLEGVDTGTDHNQRLIHDGFLRVVSDNPDPDEPHNGEAVESTGTPQGTIGGEA